MGKSKKVGLALGGGAALGASHIGVLRYLEENNYEVTHIAGTSVGALVGGAYACGVSIGEMIRFARRARWTSLTRPSIPRLGLFTNERLRDQVRRLVDDKRFDETNVPFAAIACSLISGQEIVIHEGSLVDAILASCAIPGLFEPFDTGEDLLCDGGVVNQVPDDVVWGMGAGRVIAVDLISNVTGNERPDNLFGVFYKSLNILMKRTMCYRPDTEVIYPDTTGFLTTDLKNYRTLISIGYHAAQETLSK
ncbi:MAG TPA: hypothetical protein DEF34_05650 [Desulfotomaculum sp.]|nr:hypothetical protein [Desulfotomaculum sp.]